MFVIPKKGTSGDLLTRDAFLLYYISKRGEFKGGISELSRQLGYADDSSVNKRINDLKNNKYIEETNTKSGNIYKLTRKGRKKIFFMIYPKATLGFLSALCYGNLHYGFFGTFFKVPVKSEFILGLGLMNLLGIILLFYMYRRADKELWQSYRATMQD